MASKAILTCRANSHPFQERIFALDQPVKIGRSVARSRSSPNNAIFDCKVLSRNHAMFWFSNGKFYLQDTKSSNGTFVNNQRLSKSGEESLPREVWSGDIVQFGVDVLENARKVTHGCIVAYLKLFLPDGKEAKPSTPSPNSQTPGSYCVEDLYQLNLFIQEGLQREQMLEEKLATLQTALDCILQAAGQGWKALISEDKLLSHVENLETQLQTYSKDFTEDNLRDELRKLLEDKEQYQNAAKDSLHKVLEEKIESDKKLQEVKRTLSGMESEYNNMHTLMVKSHGDIQDLAQKFSAQVSKNELLQLKYNELKEKYQQVTANVKIKCETLDILDRQCTLLTDKSSDKLEKDLDEDILISSKDDNGLSLDEDDSVLVGCDMKYQPPLSDEVQLKLVSQLQEISEKDSMNEDDLRNSRLVDEGLPEEVKWDKSPPREKEKEVLRLQLEEAQLVAEQNKLMAEDLREEVHTLRRELENKATAAGDIRLKDELNSSKQECSRLGATIALLEAEVGRLKPLEQGDGQPTAAARILQLQEELVTVQTKYHACHEERTLLAQQVKVLGARTLNTPSFTLFVLVPCSVVVLALLIIWYSSHSS